MLDLEMRRAFKGHRAADMDVRGLDIGLREAERGEEIERWILERVRRDLQRAGQHVGANRPFVEDEFDVEGAGERALHLRDHRIGKALRAQCRRVDRGRLRERAVTHRIGLDLRDIGLAIPKRAQRVRHRTVDDLEVPAAGELLEFHEREIGLDACRVAIHHETDRAGRRDDGDLRIAITMRLTEQDRLVPRALGVVDEISLRAVGMVERHRRDRQIFVACGFAIGRATMVAHHAQHRIGIARIIRERAALCGHLGRGGVADARHDRGNRAAERAARIGIIGNAGRHEIAADVGVAETERAVVVGELRDFL